MVSYIFTPFIRLRNNYDEAVIGYNYYEADVGYDDNKAVNGCNNYGDNWRNYRQYEVKV